VMSFSVSEAIVTASVLVVFETFFFVALVVLLGVFFLATPTGLDTEAFEAGFLLLAGASL
jgi:hypothetical protein